MVTPWPFMATNATESSVNTMASYSESGSHASSNINSEWNVYPPEPEVRVNDEYFNVLLFGKTGMGKSTTGNKLINSRSSQQVIRRWELEGDEGYLLVHSGEDGEPKYFEEGKEDSTKSTTTTCELLSDESGELDGIKFRVLDVEGFAPTNRGEGESCKQKNLSILRRVVRVQNSMSLSFSRVLYFIPVRGRLQKADYNIFEELEVLNHFFGSDIFDAMIVIATEDPLDGVKDWPPRKLELTKAAFVDTVREVIGRNREHPNPPIVFLPYSLSPRDVRMMIKSIPVKRESFILKFRQGVCHRCGLEFTARRVDGKVFGLTCTTDTGTVRYGETKCHPIIVTKYTGVEKFAANCMHVATLGATYVYRNSLGLPGFGVLSSYEWCPNCQQKPGSPGCISVQQVYEYCPRESQHNTTIQVNHSSDIREE